MEIRIGTGIERELDRADAITEPSISAFDTPSDTPALISAGFISLDTYSALTQRAQLAVSAEIFGKNGTSRLIAAGTGEDDADSIDLTTGEVETAVSGNATGSVPGGGPPLQQGGQRQST